MKLILILPIILIATSGAAWPKWTPAAHAGARLTIPIWAQCGRLTPRLGDGSPSIDDVRSQLRTAQRFRYYFERRNLTRRRLPR